MDFILLATRVAMVVSTCRCCLVIKVLFMVLTVNDANYLFIVL